MVSSVNEFKQKVKEDFLKVLEKRFVDNMSRHSTLKWQDVYTRLLSNDSKLFSLYQMETTGGEPDVFVYDKESDHYIFIDSSKESPSGRRSLCYDRAALFSRKLNKPKNDVISLCKEMGVLLLDEKNYRILQTFGEFDNKTSSWIETPVEIRKLNGAFFCDYRYGTVFLYHNGVESYYASRGFRAMLQI